MTSDFLASLWKRPSCGTHSSCEYYIYTQIYLMFATGRETYCKLCKTCNQMYRYQEYEDGVFNYDDYILLSHRFCLHLRSGLQVRFFLCNLEKRI